MTRQLNRRRFFNPAMPCTAIGRQWLPRVGLKNLAAVRDTFGDQALDILQAAYVPEADRETLAQAWAIASRF